MKTLLFLFVLVFLSFSAGAQKIVRVEPLSWWVGMHTPLTLMFYGENLRDCSVEVDQQGMSVRKVRNAESPNYLGGQGGPDCRESPAWRMCGQKCQYSQTPSGEGPEEFVNMIKVFDN